MKLLLKLARFFRLSPRTEKDLLLLLLNKDQRLSAGICINVQHLKRDGKISTLEANILFDILDRNKPNINIRLQFDGYWFPKGQAEPRKEFLKNIINKL